jgi:hypothetical protein
MKNYTSEVPVSITIARIEGILARAGIRNIMKDYAGAEVVALYFTLPSPTKPTASVPVRLPVNVTAVEKVLRMGYSDKRKWTKEQNTRLFEQARRTAWKLMQDWVEVQLSLIELGQVEAVEVFLPYVWDGKKSYYARIKAADFKALPVHEPEVQS